MNLQSLQKQIEVDSRAESLQTAVRKLYSAAALNFEFDGDIKIIALSFAVASKKKCEECKIKRNPARVYNEKIVCCKSKFVF